MSSPSFVVIANLYAERLAQRHPRGGWHGLTPAQRTVRNRRGREGLTAFLKTESTLHGPLRAWLTASDADDTIEIPIAKLIELLQRAVKVRRDRITDPLVSRQQAVTYGIGYRPYRVKADGWVRIGAVADADADVVLGVFWHPETGGLRMERP